MASNVYNVLVQWKVTNSNGGGVTQINQQDNLTLGQHSMDLKTPSWGYSSGWYNEDVTSNWYFYTTSSASTQVAHRSVRASRHTGYYNYYPYVSSGKTAIFTVQNVSGQQKFGYYWATVSYTSSWVSSYSSYLVQQWITTPTVQNYWDAGGNKGYTVANWKCISSPDNAWNGNTYAVGAAIGFNRIGTAKFYANIVPRTFTITLKGNGASDPAAISVSYDGKCSNLPTITRAGYIFRGWWTEDGKTQYTTSTIYKIIGNLTLYAHWDADMRTVTIDANGGTIPATTGWTITGSTATKNIQITKPYDLPTPTRSMYKFNGWYTAQTGGTKVELNATFNSDSPTKLYAQWVQNGAVVTLKDDKGWIENATGWTVSSNKKSATKGITYEDLYNVPTLSHQFWNFDGWYTAQTGGTKIESSTKFTNTSATTLYARWSPQNILIFDCNGGSKPGETMLVNPGDESRFYRVMTKNTSNNSTMWTPVHYNSTDSAANKKLYHSQYLFDGWWTSPSGGEQIYEFVSLQECRAINSTSYWDANGKYKLDPISNPENRVLYAHWKPINMYAYNSGFNPPNGNYAYPTSYIPIREAYAYKDGVWKKVTEFSAYRSGWKNGWGGN